MSFSVKWQLAVYLVVKKKEPVEMIMLSGHDYKFNKANREHPHVPFLPTITEVNGKYISKWILFAHSCGEYFLPSKLVYRLLV